MNKQQMIDDMAKSLCSFAYDGCHKDDWKDFTDEATEVFDHIVQPHLEAQQREIERLREALEAITGHGVSQSSAMNMPEEQWAWRCFNKLQWIAKKALVGEGE